MGGGFKWQRTGNGGCQQMEWNGVNTRMHVAPRSVVQLAVNGVPQFWGIVPDPPSGENPDVAQVLALGGKEALRLVLLDGRVYRGMGIYAIVRDILTRLCPPSLVYQASAVGAGDGPVLDLYYAPTSDLVTVLDALAKSAGVEWWVSAEGIVNFQAPSTAVVDVTLPVQTTRTLQVQGRETCSRAAPRIISAASEGAGASTYDAVQDRRQAYLPATLTSVATAAEHSLYRAERSVEAQTGVSLFQDSRAGALSGRDFADLAHATDGNPDTAAVGGSVPQLDLSESGKRVVGLRLRYTFAPPDGVEGRVHLAHEGAEIGDDLFWPLATSSEVRETVFLGPPSADTVGSWTGSRAEVYTIGDTPVTPNPDDPSAPGTSQPAGLSVYDLALLVVNEPVAQHTAESFLRVPSPDPAEVTLGNLLAPVPQVRVGGKAGPVSLWEYEHSAEAPTTTRIRLGSDGQSGTARAIKFAVGAT